MLMGMMASAPMGPVGVLCVQRTLNKGRWYGFVTGVGAAVSDIIYAGITGFGMSFVTDFINDAQNQRGTLWHNTWTAFLVTFSNPLIIFLFMGLFAQFAFVFPDHPFEMVIGFLSIVAGALLWWFGLSWLVDKVRAIFDDNGIKIINQIIGAVVVIFSLVFLFGTTTSLFRFF